MNTAEIQEDAELSIRPCERCGRTCVVEEIPLMGYSEYMCRKCAAAAYANDEAI